MEIYRAAVTGKVGAVLVMVGLSSEWAGTKAPIRDDMIRVAHRAGVSIRLLAETSGFGRKAVRRLSLLMSR